MSHDPRAEHRRSAVHASDAATIISALEEFCDEAQSIRDCRRHVRPRPVAASPFAAQERNERVDAEINAKIRKEGMDNSQIMRTLHYLADVYGPRLTGSPNHKAAGEWAVKR